MSALVVEPEEIAAIAAAIARSPLVAFDLEFLAQERLVPTLCLVQVAWLDHDGSAGGGDPTGSARGAGVLPRGIDAPEGAGDSLRVALIDPLAGDAKPVVDAIAAHACAVAHAARQDLQLLAARFGASVRGISDTQVMAAFAGLGDQIGIAGLASELVGVTLGKELQWTDWAQRPLTRAQLAYADADVRHLPTMYAILVERLGERMAWARAESAIVAGDAEAAARVTPETAWQEIGTRGLDAAALGAVIALAAWRQRAAIALDRPLGQLLNDRALLELARRRPATEAAVRETKQLSPFAKQRAAEIVEVIAAAPPAEGPLRAASRAPSARAQRWADVLLTIAQHAAERTGVATRLLSTRADAEEFARAVDERGIDAAHELPALTTWRRDVLGTLWLGWLTGSLALVGDPAQAGGIDLVAR